MKNLSTKQRVFAIAATVITPTCVLMREKDDLSEMSHCILITLFAGIAAGLALGWRRKKSQGNGTQL